MYGFEFEQFPNNEIVLNSKFEDMKPIKIGFHF